MSNTLLLQFKNSAFVEDGVVQINKIVPNAIKVKDYKCPSCKEDPSDDYNVDGQDYPISFNESKGSTMDGNYHDWDELHKCITCGTDFWFKNGAY